MNYGRYQIVKELGKGAMGVVYQAHDPQIDRMVALKVLRQERLLSEEFVQRFLKEAKAIGRLSHPNIVTVYDVGQDHGTIYIAMEFLEGKPLDEIMKETRLDHKEMVNIGVQVAEALDYAHQKGIVHRDIKPPNIIITPDGQVKITDFGIARIDDPLATQQTRAGVILGTPVYMSPEQVLGKEVGGRSDLYSLGVILYEFAVGTKPFKGDSLAVVFRAITQDSPDAPAKIDGSVSPALSEIIMKSLRKEPAERFQAGKEMAAALKACLREEDAGALTRQPGKDRIRNIALIAVIPLIIACAIVGYLYFYPPNGKEVVLSILKVDSVPNGAQVFLDNSFKGKTPLKLDLPVGKYDVRLSLHDYHEWEAQVQLREKEETPLNIRLFPME